MLPARYDIGALQTGMFKKSTLGVFINSEWSAFVNSGSGHVRNSELGTTFGGHSEPNWGHSDLRAQSGRKNQPACITYHLKECDQLRCEFVCDRTKGEKLSLLRWQNNKDIQNLALTGYFKSILVIVFPLVISRRKCKTMTFC